MNYLGITQKVSWGRTIKPHEHGLERGPRRFEVSLQRDEQQLEGVAERCANKKCAESF